MCGLWGISSSNVDKYYERAQTLNGLIRHRGPDDSGVWFEPSNGILLGHTRLSVQDISSHAAQPMHSHSNRYHLVYNGEIYNRDELKKYITNYKLSGHSDTEILLANIEVHGLNETLPKLVGMFAFALYDSKLEKIYCVRDRVGIKPLYYSVKNNELVFSSELRVIKEIYNNQLSINQDSVSLFTRHNYIPEPYSIYSDVYKITPGHCVEYDIEKQEIVQDAPYWDLQNFNCSSNQAFKTFEDAVNYYEDLIEDSVRLRLISDVPIGCFLSGGYDSTLVALMMQRHTSTPINTFSIGFNEQEYDEAVYAKRIAEELGTRHTELYISQKQALELVPELPNIYDEPFADSSQLPTLLLSRLARKQVTVCLTGDGGDEVFGGYNRYIWANKLNNIMGYIPNNLKRALSHVILSASKDKLNNFANHCQRIFPERFRIKMPGDKLFKVANMLNNTSLIDSYHSIVSIMHNPGAINLNQSNADVIRSKLEKVRGVSDISLMQLIDILTYLPGDILTKVDRASMSVGLETRVPLLDHRLVESITKLPDCYKVKSGRGKLVLREIVHRSLPMKLMDRPKMGFGIPVGKWIREDLNDYVQDHLSYDAITRVGVYDYNAIKRIWDEHRSGTKNNEYVIWGIIMMQSWILNN